MKKLTSGLIALALAAALPLVASAQTTAPGAAADHGTKAERGTKKERASWSNTQGLHETGDIIGTKVEGADGKDLGKVDALLIDPKDGKVSDAVIGVGGVLGVGAEKVVVPYSALKMTGHESGKKARITIDEAALDSAPKYVKATERSSSPSASPATAPRSDTKSVTSGSSGFSGDPRSDTAKSSDSTKSNDASQHKVGATQSDAKSPATKY